MEGVIDFLEAFKNHPSTDTFYFTGDGQAFFLAHHASGHAANLKQKGLSGAVITKTRHELHFPDSTAELEKQIKENGIEHIITSDDLKENPELAAAGVKEGEVVIIPEDAIINDPIELLTYKVEAAQFVLDEAMKGTDSDAIAAAKKALTTAKGKLTKAKKGVTNDASETLEGK